MPRGTANTINRFKEEVAQKSLRIENRHVWLRDHKRDLHLIERKISRRVGDMFEFDYVAPLANSKLPVSLDEWLRQEMPNTPTGVVEPIDIHDFHNFDWLIPYVDFSSEGLARYIAEWEGVQQRAQTAGFKRTTIEYENWRMNLSRYNICNTPRTEPTEVLWWDTPVGIFWCEKRLIDEVGEEITSVSSYSNLWLRAQEQYPQLANFNLRTIVRGRLVPNDVVNDAWFCEASWPSSATDAKEWYTHGRRSNGSILPEERTVRQHKICTFLGAGQERVKFR